MARKPYVFSFLNRLLLLIYLLPPHLKAFIELREDVKTCFKGYLHGVAADLDAVYEAANEIFVLWGGWGAFDLCVLTHDEGWVYLGICEGGESVAGEPSELCLAPLQLL